METRNFVEWFKNNKRNALIMFSLGVFTHLQRYSLNYLFTKNIIDLASSFRNIQTYDILSVMYRIITNILGDLFGEVGINVKF